MSQGEFLRECFLHETVQGTAGLASTSVCEALNDNVDVLKELGHLHEKMPLSVAVIFVDAHQATIVHDSWRDLASAAAVSRVRKTSSEAPQPCRLQASAWSTSCYWLPAKIVCSPIVV